MKQYFEIVDVTAREVIDSLGWPTVEAEVTLDDGTLGRASSPTCRKADVCILHDGDAERYSGKGVKIAVENINTEIAEAMVGLNALDQRSLDRMLLEIDGTDDCSRLGANAVLAVSLACAKAAAEATGMSLYSYIGGVNSFVLPVPMMMQGKRILIGDKANSFSEALRMCIEASHKKTNEEASELCTVITEKEINDDFVFASLAECATLTEFLDNIRSIRSIGQTPVLSVSEGETDDTALSDIAVAVNAGYLRIRDASDYCSMVKCNELMRIEEELFDVPQLGE